MELSDEEKQKLWEAVRDQAKRVERELDSLPFQPGDRITAVTKDGATTKVRGTVREVKPPIDAEWDVWEFIVEWDDHKTDQPYCFQCGKSAPEFTEAAGGAIKRTTCCNGGMGGITKARDTRVSEGEIKKLSITDMLAELDTPKGETP